MKVMMHVQHLLGIGHQTRAAAMARAMQRNSIDVVYVSGGLPVPGLDLGAARLVQLPGARTGDATFTHLVDDRGRVVDHLLDLRIAAADQEHVVGLIDSFLADLPGKTVVETEWWINTHVHG